VIGQWRADSEPPFTDTIQLKDALRRIREPLYVIGLDGGYAF
jgi:hypothetical protein